MGAYGAGGALILSYTNGTDRWELLLHVARFDPATFAYTGVGPTYPIEGTVGDTFIGLGDIWAPYFDPSWTLSLEAIYWNDGTESHRVADPPVVGGVAGMSGTPSSAFPPIRRGFTFRDSMGKKQTVRLIGVATDTIATHRVVTRSTGGFDARDQAVVAYLSGARTGVVMFDGNGYPSSAFVWQRAELRPFERAAPAPSPSAALPTGRTGDILYHDPLGWRTLPIGARGQDLQVETVGTDLLPRWDAPTFPPLPTDSDGGYPGSVPTTTLTPDGVVPTWQMPCGAASCAEVPPISTRSTDAPSVDQGRCGAALAMADYLEHLYGLIGGFVDSGIAMAVGGSLSAMVSALVSIFFGPEAALPTFAVALPPLITLARLVLGASVGFFPTLDSTNDTAILRTCYQSLNGGGRSIVISPATIAMWAKRIEASSDLPAPEPKRLLELILAVPVLGTWQGKAYTGAQTGSTACLGFGVPSYAMSGGAVLGRAGRAMRGGAFMGLTAHRSVRGGGYYDHPAAQSMMGGASAT